MKKFLKVMARILMVTFLLFPLQGITVFANEGEEANDTSETSDDASTSSQENSYRGLVAHWKFDGDLKDSSPFGNNGSAVGKIEFADAILGKGAKFNGNSYVKVADSDTLDLKDAFTFSMWVFKEDMRTNSSDFMDVGVPYFEKMNEQYGYWPYGMYEWWRYTPGVSYGFDDSEDSIHSDVPLDMQKWALLTSTYDGESMKIFINDQLVKSQLVSVTLDSNSMPLYIGFGHFMNKDNFFKGIMDDLRIYNKALTYEEVEDLYNAGLSGPGKNLLVKPNRLVAYYNFEGNGNDSSIMKNNATAVNAKGGITYVTGMVGKAAKFNGASYFKVPDSNSLDLDKFTIGVWVNEEKTSVRNPIIAKYGESNSKKDASYSLYDSYAQSGISLDLLTFDEDKDDFDIRANTKVTTGRWYYYTVTYDGKNLKLYNNGALVKTVECETEMSYSSGPMWIGAFMDGSFFKGTMDELRIYNYALTPTEVKKLYGYVDKVESISTDTKIKLNSMVVNNTVQLKTTYTAYSFTAPTAAVPNGADVYKGTDVTSKAVYTSSNIKVVTVSTTGKITAVGRGSASITVTYNGRTTAVNIVVK